jgi:hypothetical protein
MWRSGSPHTSSIRGSPGRARSTRFARDSALEGDRFEPSVSGHGELCCRALALDCLRG